LPHSWFSPWCPEFGAALKTDWFQKLDDFPADSDGDLGKLVGQFFRIKSRKAKFAAAAC
jgi:hypothetical protein